jgi:hypothetical protein
VTVPPGAPPWISGELIEETLRVWQPYYAELLTVDDAVAIIQAVKQLLREIS